MVGKEGKSQIESLDKVHILFEPITKKRSCNCQQKQQNKNAFSCQLFFKSAFYVLCTNQHQFYEVNKTMTAIRTEPVFSPRV